MDSQKAKPSTAVEKVSEQNKEFAIIALTGKVRSGTSDISRLLTNPDFFEYTTRPADTSPFQMSEIREHLVMYRYLHHNWKPFIELRVRSVIISFLLDATKDELKSKTFKLSSNKNDNTDDLHVAFMDCLTNYEEFKSIVKEKIEKVLVSLYFIGHSNTNDKMQELHDKSSADFDKCLEQLKEKVSDIDQLLELWKSVKKRIESRSIDTSTLAFCYGILPALGQLLEKRLGKDEQYTKLFQDFGNNIRAYGTAIINNDKVVAPNPEKLFCLPNRINQFIKVLRHYSSEENPATINNVFVVINNLKNVFETFYFKRRYSAFYLVAISCEEDRRKARFSDIQKYTLNDLRENLFNGKKLYKKIEKYEEMRKADNENEIRTTLGINKNEWEFAQELFPNSRNCLRRICYENNLAPFILQDVMTCIENADIFLTRDFKEKKCQHDYPLIHSLARVVTLILHPGLLTPTKTERCMQIAMTAKLNSGCLSRQVGAVVTDSEYNILSLGWNDTPCGVESCIRRNIYDLFKKRDPDAYSDYELYDDGFRSYLDTLIENFDKPDKKRELKGLPFAFCFKDIYQDIITQRDQIYTRALHGEERALAACGNERARGGYLFTTSSPCELCAKKAKEARISKIYYIEQYPGISHTHIIDSGDKSKRATYEFFVGAVGLAYVKLYTPILPYKDELAAFGFSLQKIKPSSNINDEAIMDNEISKQKSYDSPQEQQDQQ